MTTKVMVSFPNEFLIQVDAFAKAEHRSRSELVREALRQYMASHQRTVHPSDMPQVQATTELQDALSRISPGTGEENIEDGHH